MPTEQVDLLTLDRAYYLEPDSASPKAYVLLRKTLEQTDRTAIVRFSLRQKTRLAALRVRGDVLVLQTLLWADEVREAAFPALDEPVRISAKELELSASLVESFAADFDPSEFSDEYQDELRTLIEAKLEKGDALDTTETFGEHEEEAKGGEVIDLMEALRASVERSRAARSGGAKDGRPRPPRRARREHREVDGREERREEVRGQEHDREEGPGEEGREGVLSGSRAIAGCRANRLRWSGALRAACLRSPAAVDRGGHAVAVRVLGSALEHLGVEHEFACLLGVGDDIRARRGSLLRLAALAEVVPERDERGAADGDQQDDVDVLGDEVGDPRDEPDQVAEHREPEAPEHRADEVVERVLAPWHVADAGGDRREGAHDRHEAGEDDRQPAEPLEERVGALDVLDAEQAGFLAFEDGRPALVADEVPDLAADEGGEARSAARRPRC